MNCEEFHDRLNDCLDDRRQPSRDRRLLRHAAECRECRDELHAWECINQSLAPPQRRPIRADRGWSVALPTALAASLVFLLISSWRADRPEERPIVAHQPAAAPKEPAEVAVVLEIDGSEAQVPQTDVPSEAVPWNEVAWIDRWSDRVAEPLEPLSHGFAPLGRSFQTAVTLLVLPREIAEVESPPPFPQPLQSEIRCSGLDVNYA